MIPLRRQFSLFGGYSVPTVVAMLLGFPGLGCRSAGDHTSVVTVPADSMAGAAELVALPALTPEPVRHLADDVKLVQFQADEELVLPGLIVQPETIDHDTATPMAAPQPVEHYVQLALAVHPRIQAAQARVAAAAQRIPQARALEDPVLQSSIWPSADLALQTADGRAVNDLSVSQAYPLPVKRDARAAVANREMQMAAARLAQVQLEIEEAARLAYYELWFADQAIAITERNRQIGAELVTLAEARNRAGGSQQDILRAQLQLDAIDNRLIELRQQKAVAQADLAALIQQPAMEGIEPTQALEVPEAPSEIESLFAAAEQCSPRLRERLAQVSRDRQELRLADLGRYPDLMLGTGWMNMTTDDAISAVATGAGNFSLMVGMTLPIWRGRINASVREASAEVAASAREYDDARNDVLRQLRRLSEQALAADEQLQLYENRILPRTRQTLQLASADYRGQLVTFGEVVDSFTELLMFELQAARARATLAGTLAQLERVVGCAVAAESE